MAARLLLAADLVAASTALATAFADDPMMAWAAGDGATDGRVERSATGFFAPGLAAGLKRGHSYGVPGAEGFEGVAVWSPPDVEMFDEAEGGAFATAFVDTYGEEAFGRLMALNALTDEFHPHDRPHFYLLFLGATVRGRGAGAQVVAPVLDRCDADGIGAYLESSNPRNVGFYERLGFEATWADVPEPGGPLLTGMWRDPRD
jgi:GNAT superfamily N-acetyltransferase